MIDRKLLKLLFCFLFLNVFIVSTFCTNPSPFPQKTKRVLFLGNSITYAGTYIADIEIYFVTHYPDHEYEFINLGLPSETVSGLSEENHANGEFPRPCLFSRLDNVLKQAAPDVVFACYGMNDGIFQPFDETIFGSYKDGIERLYKTLKEFGVEKENIYIMTPPIHVDAEVGLDGYNQVLDKYSEWLLSLRDSANWNIIDLHFPMKNYLVEKQKSDNDFKLANDGVHPGDLGHWLMAKEILLYLGEDVKEAESIESTMEATPQNTVIAEEIRKRQNVMKDSWLTTVGHERPQMNAGLPMKEARKLYEISEEKLSFLKK